MSGLGVKQITIQQVLYNRIVILSCVHLLLRVLPRESLLFRSSSKLIFASDVIKTDF